MIPLMDVPGDRMPLADARSEAAGDVQQQQQEEDANADDDVASCAESDGSRRCGVDGNGGVLDDSDVAGDQHSWIGSDSESSDADADAAAVLPPRPPASAPGVAASSAEPVLPAGASGVELPPPRLPRQVALIEEFFRVCVCVCACFQKSFWCVVSFVFRNNGCFIVQ